MPHRHLRHAPATIALLACLALAACNIVGPAVYFIGGPEKTEAQYELDPAKPVVVFIDDRANLIPDRATRRRVGASVDRALLDNAKLQRVIASDGALAVVSREKFGQPLGIAEVGEAVNADVVVYALIDSFTLTPDGVSLQPSASARVRVVDVKTKQRLWPPDNLATSFPVGVSTPNTQGTIPRNLGERAAAERRLADQLGVAIAQVFYKHETSPSTTRVGGSESFE